MGAGIVGVGWSCAIRTVAAVGQQEAQKGCASGEKQGFERHPEGGFVFEFGIEEDGLRTGNGNCAVKRLD